MSNTQITPKTRALVAECPNHAQNFKSYLSYAQIFVAFRYSSSNQAVLKKKLGVFLEREREIERARVRDVPTFLHSEDITMVGRMTKRELTSQREREV